MSTESLGYLKGICLLNFPGAVGGIPGGVAAGGRLGRLIFLFFRFPSRVAPWVLDGLNIRYLWALFCRILAIHVRVIFGFSDL